MRRLVIELSVITLIAASTVCAAPLTLKECIEQGKQRNPLLVTLSNEKEIAATSIRQADSALYPRIDLQGGYTAQQAAQGVIMNGRTAETQEPEYAFANTAVSYTLYDFGRREAKRRSARFNADAIGHNIASREKEVFLQIITTYFGILEAQQLVTAAEKEVAQVSEHRRIAEIMHQQGMVTRNDVLQADVRLASARQKHLSTRNTRENLWLRLNFLTGSPPTRRGELEEGTDQGVPPDTPPDRLRALTARTELLALRKSLEAGDSELEESRKAFYPELFTRLELDYVQNDRVAEQTIMSATVGVRMNIFDGFSSTAARQRAALNRMKIEDAIRQTEAEITLELTTAYNDAKVANERIAVTRTAIEQSEENLRINRDRYQARVGTATDVLDAQTLLTQAKTEHFQALYEYRIASARVRRALGEL